MSLATVGVLYPVFSPLNTHTEGSMPTYGTGVVLNELREVTVTKSFNDNPLEGDNHIVDEDNGLTGLSYSVENTGLSNADRVKLFGEEAYGTTGQWESDNETPYGGFGHIEKMRADSGTITYEAYICLKIKFQQDEQTARTKEGNQITWGVPRITGNAAALDVDGTGKLRYRLHASFSTANAAKSFINTMLNVSATTT